MNFAFIQIKVFGDLTIAVSSLQKLPATDRGKVSLVIGPHLKGLCDLLAPDCRIEVVDITGVRNAALFDIRNQGILPAVQTAGRWRDALSVAARESILVFDKLKFRERYIAGGRNAIGLPPTENVYSSYEQFFKNNFGFVPPPDKPASHSSGRRFGIYPVSRIAAKSLPLSLVTTILENCLANGFDPYVVLLDGERLEGLPPQYVHRLPRTFEDLMNSIRGFDAILSADSLPAHLAENLGRPVFVASPVPNAYWLPASSFNNNHWGVFSDLSGLQGALESFMRKHPALGFSGSGT